MSEVESRSGTLSPPLCGVPRQETFFVSTGSPPFQKFIGNNALPENFFWGTMLLAMNWMALQAGSAPECKVSVEKEQSMRNHLLAITAIMAAVSAPIAAQAQNTVGVAGPGAGAVVVDDGTVGIALDQRPAFRQYIVRERVPSYAIPDRVIVGGILPESGITFYDVPQSFGATPYRYTVVNGETVLVEPRTRRIVQVID
jgi:Protein of unknown function (DUF1236)